MALLVSLGFGLVINIAWLAFLSDMLARFVFRADLPLPRAAKCVVIGYAISWGLAFVLAVVSPIGAMLVRVDWFNVLPGAVAAALVFLWEWRSFQRHWIAEEDHEEIFG